MNYAVRLSLIASLFASAALRAEPTYSAEAVYSRGNDDVQEGSYETAKLEAKVEAIYEPATDKVSAGYRIWVTFHPTLSTNEVASADRAPRFQLIANGLFGERAALKFEEKVDPKQGAKGKSLNARAYADKIYVDEKGENKAGGTVSISTPVAGIQHQIRWWLKAKDGKIEDLHLDMVDAQSSRKDMLRLTSFTPIYKGEKIPADHYTHLYKAAFAKKEDVLAARALARAPKKVETPPAPVDETLIPHRNATRRKSDPPKTSPDSEWQQAFSSYSITIPGSKEGKEDAHMVARILAKPHIGPDGKQAGFDVFLRVDQTPFAGRYLLHAKDQYLVHGNNNKSENFKYKDPTLEPHEKHPGKALTAQLFLGTFGTEDGVHPGVALMTDSSINPVGFLFQWGIKVTDGKIDSLRVSVDKDLGQKEETLRQTSYSPILRGQIMQPSETTYPERYKPTEYGLAKVPARENLSDFIPHKDAKRARPQRPTTHLANGLY